MMKRIFPLIPLLSLMLGLFSISATVYASEPQQFEYVTPCKWAYIGNFFDGLAVVKNFGTSEFSLGYSGYIDRFGKIQIDLVWDDALSFSEGLAAVKKDGKWGYINQTGDVVIPLQFHSADYFSNERALIGFADGTYGYITPTGELISSGWRTSQAFSEGFAAVLSLDGKCGFIDIEGNVVVQPTYSHAMPFNEGLAAVRIDNRNYGYIDCNGNVVLDFKYNSATSFIDGYAKVRFGYADYMDVCIDQTGTIVAGSERLAQLIRKDEDEYVVSLFRQGIVHLSSKKNGARLYNIATGQSFPCDSTRIYANGGAMLGHQLESKRLWPLDPVLRFVSFFEEKSSIFDLNFNIRISPVWDRIESVSENIAVVALSDESGYLKYGYVDMNDETVLVAPIFSGASPFKEGRSIVENDRKYGIVRIVDDGPLFQDPTQGVIGTASPTTIYINDDAVSAYYFDGAAYMEVALLAQYGFHIKKSIDDTSFFVTMRDMKDVLGAESSFVFKDAYDVSHPETSVYFNNNPVRGYDIDGITTVLADELACYGTVHWNVNENKLGVYINRPYLQNEGITWRWCIDSFGHGAASYIKEYFITISSLPNYDRKYSVFNKDLQLLFQTTDYSRLNLMPDGSSFAGLLNYSGWDFLNDKGEVIGHTPASLSGPWYTPPTPEPKIEYPLLKIEGRHTKQSLGDWSTPTQGTCKYYDESDNVVLDDNWGDAQPFINGTALVNEGAHLMHSGYEIGGGKWGLIDTLGNYIVDPTWDGAMRNTNGYITFTTESMRGIADNRGKILVPAQYKQATVPYGSNNVLVENLDGQWGTLTLDNQVNLPMIFRTLKYQQDQYCSVGTQSGEGVVQFIDRPVLQGGVYVNGEPVAFDTPPLLINDRTMIPIRAVFEKMGCTVEWIEENNTAIITRGDIQIEIKQATNVVIKNGEYSYSDTAAINYRDRIHVPLRVIAQALGCHVSYDDATQNINITY